MKVWPGKTSLNGVCKRRLTAKETSMANCEVLDEKYRITVQGIFVDIIILEIRFRKNLAKLKGSAVRIKSKKPKGKKTMTEKKTGSSHGGI